MDYTAQRGCMQKSVQPFFVFIVLAFPYAVDVAAVAFQISWFHQVISCAIKGA